MVGAIRDTDVVVREGEDVGSFRVCLSELNHRGSLLAVVVGVPFPAQFLVDDALAIFTVGHVLFFDGCDEGEAVSFFPIPASGFTESSDDAITISVSVRLKVLELVVYVNLLAVNNYLFHITRRLEIQTTPSREAHTGC